MILQEDTPPVLLEQLQAAPPTPKRIALRVTVEAADARRVFWMSEGGTLFFSRRDGYFCRATPAQATCILRGLELARRSAHFDVQGQVVDAHELEVARGLIAI